MKKVVDAATVAHLWANQIQYEARTPNHNFYFTDKEIYSYGRHYLVAKFVTNEAGNDAVLITERRYSNTTSTHQALVRNATRHHNQIFVPDAMDTKLQNFTAWLNEIQAISKKLAKARKPENYLYDIASIYNKVKIYADFWSVEIPDELKAYSNELDSSEIVKAIKEREVIKQLAEAKQLAETLEKWKNFEFSGYFVNNSGFDYLRYNTEIDRVETSQGVKIPADIAKPFYKHILSVIAAGGCTNCDTKLMNAYEVKQINKNMIIVGCHKIEIKEIKALTNKLGW